jgi:hypothetical protein
LRLRPLLLKVLYWLAVLVVSLALLVLLVLFFESRDSSQVRDGEARIDISGAAAG